MLACVIFIKATLLRSLKISLSPLHRSTLSTSSGLSSETPVWEKTSFPLSQTGCRRLCWDSPLLSGQSVHPSLQSLHQFFCLFHKNWIDCFFVFFLLFQVRNSSTLLFSTLITRIFGVKKGKDEHSKKNRSLSSVSCCLLTQGGAVAPAPRLKKRLWWRSRF